MSIAMNLRRSRAFTLIELVIVVVIIGILAAIAVPRMSRGAAAATDSALSANVAQLRGALDHFYVEHNNTYPAIGDLTKALTQFSDVAGAQFQTTKDEVKGIIYGPYIAKIPAVGAGPNRAANDFVATLGGAAGWVYDAATGTITPNVPDGVKDGKGIEYNKY